MKKLFSLFLLIISQNVLPAQNGNTEKLKIAVFTPIYLDSAFDAMGNYRYEKSFPKFINPGLEFYEGVQLAIDSLIKEGAKLDVYVYDTRSSMKSLAEHLNDPRMDSIDLIIAQPSGSEIKLLADAAKKRNIFFINATAPINGGVIENPFYVQLTPTLKTQVEATYKYIQKYYSLDQLVVFRKKGEREDEIRSYFEEAGKTTLSVPLKLKYVDLPDEFTVRQLTPYLDSTKEFLCIAGSLDENFATRLSAQLASLSKTYDLTLLGMSTWHTINFVRPEYKGLEIVYGTPFYNPRTDLVSLSISNHFALKIYARPSDMVFRGYEVFMRFTRILMQNKTEVSSQLPSRRYKIFNDFDIQPVINRSTLAMDYFENKRLNFIKWKDGVLVGVNW